MRTFFCCGVVLSGVLAGTASPQLLAQQRDEVSLFFGITDSEELPAPPARVYRLYGEPSQLRFALGVGNFHTSKMPVLIDVDAIRRTFGLLIERETEIPVTIQWLDEMRLNSEPVAPPSGSSWVRLDPSQQLGWTIVVERADRRPFSNGQYYLTGGFQGVRNAVRTVDGTTYQGQVLEPLGQWSLLVRPPTSAAERVRMHKMAGGNALARGDTTRALSEYTQLLEVDPANVEALIAMGDIHLRTGRYREAIEWWERAAPNVPRGSYLPVSLAYAYVGAGEDHKAGEVLRAAAFDDRRVTLELDRARRAAIERPAGVPIRSAAAQVAAPAAAVAISQDGPAPDPQQLLLRLRETAQREAAQRAAGQR